MTLETFRPDIMIVGDLHLHERAEFSAPVGENPRLLDGLNILDQIISITEKMKIKEVVFTGDLFELKDKIPNHILVPFSKRITKLCDIGLQIIALRGNHDFKFPEFSVTSIFPNIVFVDDVFTWFCSSKIGFIPYYRDPEEFKEKWISYHKRQKPSVPDILIFHQELPGAYYSKGMKVPADWDIPVFPNTLYVGGHLHQPHIVKMKNNEIIYIGTPYQIDFDDVKEQHTYHVLLYDSQSKEYNFLILNYPKFLEININDTIGDYTNFEHGDNYIRFVGVVQPQKRNYVKSLKKELINLGAKGVQIKVKYLTEHISRIKAEKTDHRGIVSQYLRGSDTTLDKDKLLKTGLNLLEKAK